MTVNIIPIQMTLLRDSEHCEIDFLAFCSIGPVLMIYTSKFYVSISVF